MCRWRRGDVIGVCLGLLQFPTLLPDQMEVRGSDESSVAIFITLVLPAFPGDYSFGEMAINCGRPTKIEAKRTHSTLDRTAARAGAQSSPPCSFNLLTNTMDFREKHRCSMACKQIGLILLSRRLQDWPIEKSPKIPEEAANQVANKAEKPPTAPIGPLGNMGRPGVSLNVTAQRA
jgi:hypothetical protein